MKITSYSPKENKKEDNVIYNQAYTKRHATNHPIHMLMDGNK